MSKLKNYKYCIVPKCVSTTSTSPEKLFFLVPYEPKIRRKWMRVIKRDNPLGDKTTAFCCEDHFDMVMCNKSAASAGAAGAESNTDHYGYKKDYRTALPQCIAVSVKNFLLLGYGMTLGFPTILIPAVKDPKEGEILHLQNPEISWISSINLIVVPVGCALSGAATSPIGRRRAMQMVNVPFLIAWLLFHFSNTTGHLYGALFLTGLAGGLLEAPVMTYVAEITQPHLRGALSATSSMCIIIGVFTQFLFGRFLYWRTVALVNIAFTILSVISLCFIPESPHWLVSRKRFDDARKSLQWLRGWKKTNAVENELTDIKALYKNQQGEKGVKSDEEVKPRLWDKMSCYLNRSFLIPFFLVSYSFFVGHFSGMTTLQMLEAPIDKYYATLILGVVQIVGAAMCVLLVHYTGKRPLTHISTAGAGVCCILIASYDGYIRTHGVSVGTSVMDASDNNLTSPLLTNDQPTRNPYSWMPTALLMLLAFLTHTGIRLLPWILIGEVFSARTRSGGAGLAGAVGYIFGFLANKMYIAMVDSINIFGTYGLYGIICLTGSVVFYFILPETEGKKLNDIENHFAGIKRLTNNVEKSKGKTAPEMAIMHEIIGNINLSFEGDSSHL